MSSFWDRLKPAPQVPTAVDARLAPGGTALLLTWDDGLKTELPTRLLRQECPCAECVDEWSGKRTLVATSVPENLTATGPNPVGNYAVSFTFSDRHRTGIYNWTLLRKLGAELAKASGA